MTKKINMRELALETLLEIERSGVPSHVCIHDVLEKYAFLPARDRSFYRRLTEGTLEYRIQLDYLIDLVAKTKTEKMKPVIREILRMAVYQLWYMDSVPDSAAVNESVRLCARKGFGPLRGFVNGILRSLIRKKEEIHLPDRSDPAKYMEIAYSVPIWLVKEWTERYGTDLTEQICRAFLRVEPVTVRIRHPEDAERILESMRRDGAELRQSEILPFAWELKCPDGPAALSAFRDGEIAVQDVSSMLAVLAAGIKEGDTVLDLCAAPGGKSLLASDLMHGTGSVISRDLTERKTGLIRENAERCRISNINIQERDATIPDGDMQDAADVVIADLPCSGYGVIGRKPDIKYRASEEKTEELVRLQRLILRNAAGYVKPGGTLLYSTCTFNIEENENNVRWAQQELGLYRESIVPFMPPRYRGGTAAEGYLQLLPGRDPCDGFFFARLIRPA